jgi:hypothetical protein
VGQGHPWGSDLIAGGFLAGSGLIFVQGPASISAKVADVVKCVSAIGGKADMAIAPQNVRHPQAPESK